MNVQVGVVHYYYYYSHVLKLSLLSVGDDCDGPVGVYVGGRSTIGQSDASHLQRGFVATGL